MRGDALRDLYAKTLALLGLGVLAGAGALVDYWPIGFNFPNVSSALQIPTTAAAMTTEEPVAVDVKTAPRARAPHSLAGLQTTLALPTIPAGEPSGAPLGVAVALGEPVRTTEPGPTLMAAAESRNDPMVAFVEGAGFDGGTLAEHTAYRPAVLASADEGDGFITGAFKKTGSSIVKTSVRTGASIFDAVRVVGGVVRRALPN